MNMMKVIAVPMHPEGRKFVAIFAAITAALWLVWEPLFWMGVGMTVWCYYFFRDPVRSVAQKPGLILSPADGVVSLITKTVPPVEMLLGDKPLTRVSVFMNVFNCHVNRAPMAGEVIAITYHHGKFVNASQIAGLVARRIVCFTKLGNGLSVGERFGLIRFGSRLDVFLPEGIQPTVGLGQTAVAGETILAHLDGINEEWPIQSV
jgi:phosphatidylserine decarboxylase